jgi:hypothetical protein
LAVTLKNCPAPKPEQGKIKHCSAGKFETRQKEENNTPRKEGAVLG